MAQRPLLSIDEVAARLSISKTGIYRLVARRELPCYRVGSVLRFGEDQLEAYLRGNRVGS